MATMSNLDQALEYANRGWKVVPLHTPDAQGKCSCHKADCPSVGKHPRTMNGAKDATTDTEKLARWWDMWPDANIGVLTGAESGIVVLDVDVKSGGDKTLKHLIEQHGKFDEKVYANTGGGGWHIIFRHPGGHWPNTQGGPNKPSKLGAGLDFRGDGGYIAAPGSLHASGKRYEWGQAPNGHMPEMPDWLKSKLGTSVTQPVSVGGTDALIPGDRHLTLLAWAGAMRRKGMSGQAILAALRIENQHRCNPPKDDAELVRIADFVGNKNPEDPVLAQKSLEQAVDVPSDTPGLYTLDAYETQLDDYYQNGLPRGLNVGWEKLSQLYTILPRYLTMITGTPTAGKSHFMNALAVNMMLIHGWKFAVATPEFTPPAYYYSRFMETYTGSPFYEGPTPRIDSELYAAAKRDLKERLFFIEARNGEPLTIPFVMSMAKRAAEEYGINGLILDPWAKFDHFRPDSMTETEYIRVTINKLQHFLDHNNLHGFLIVHPKMVYTPGDADGPVITPYALPGSANWYNLAHNIISLYRRKSEQTNKVEVHVQKVKPHYIGSEGVSELYYDKVTGQYSERSEANNYYERQEDPDYIPEF